MSEYEQLPMPISGTIPSLKTMVHTIKHYCLPEYPANDKGQKPFIGVVLDEVVKEIEASICIQQTNHETEMANVKYIQAIPALCRGEAVPCAMHVSQPIVELRQKYQRAEARIAELEAEVQRLREQTQWRPIETAPKDKPLLLGRFWRNALWDKNEPSVFFQWTGSWEDRSLDKSGCSSDWTEYHGLQPTHWMPLPQPPQEQESESERCV